MGKPAKCISENEARTLQNNWVNTREPTLTRELGEQDCREVLFSLEELQEYLNYVKDESDRQGITNPGIRVYFGAYDDSNSNKATVFLAPTKAITDGSDNNYNIDAYNRGVNGNPPTSY